MSPITETVGNLNWNTENMEVQVIGSTDYNSDVSCLMFNHGADNVVVSLGTPSRHEISVTQQKYLV